MTARAVLAFAVVMFATGCDFDRPWPALEPSWERMMEQPHAVPYQSNRTFADRQAMRPLPQGSMPYRGANVATALTRDERDRLVDVAVPVTEALLHEGRTEFDVVCATCHGILGNGDSPVADRMTLRKPPSLHEPRIRAYTSGHLFNVVTEGFGVMPAYAAELSAADRWAIVAYVRALQLSFDAPLAMLSGDVRAEAERELR